MLSLRTGLKRPSNKYLSCAVQRCFSTDAVSTSVDYDTFLPVNYTENRCGVSGINATVFGSSGFLGRYVVNRLGRIGSQVVLPYRGDGMNMRHLKMMGDLGQITSLPIDFTEKESIRKTLTQSNVVVNLIGNCHQTANYNYHDTHVKTVFRLCQLAAENPEIKRFIHVSAFGADLESASPFLRSKAEGEQVVKDFFPKATIIRPTSMWGWEDNYLNRYAMMMNHFPFIPIIDHGTQKIQPVHVQDVAQGIVECISSSFAPGETFELAGPDVFTNSEVMDYVMDGILRPDVRVFNMNPNTTLKLYAKIVEKILPVKWRYINEDVLEQMKLDQIITEDTKCKQFADLDIKPSKMHSLEADNVLLKHRGERHRKYFDNPKRYGGEFGYK